MPEFKKTCSIDQCFNFKKDVQSPVGVINFLQIGKTLIAADMTVTDPASATGTTGTNATTQDAGTTMTIVGALSEISWGLGDVMPVVFSGAVSVRNKQLINSLLFSQLIDIKVLIGWTVYDFDELFGAYYVCFSTANFATASAGITAQIKKEGEADLKLTIESTPITDVVSPKLYPFTLEVVPQPTPVPLYLATSHDDKVTKSWGRLGPKAA